MSQPVWTAMIVSLPPTILVIMVLIWVRIWVRASMRQLYADVNSRMDKFVEEVRTAARAEGVLIERDREKGTKE
jgi:predicted Holliday junction resolvase-like endonuclease